MKRARRRRVSAFAVVTAVFVAALCALWSQFGETLLRDAYAGRSFELLNRFIAGHRSINPTIRTEDYYVGAAPRAYAASAFLGLTMFAAFIAFELRQGIARFYTRFLLEPVSPFTLAFLRIATFSIVLWMLLENRELIATLAGMPAETRKPTFGMNWLAAAIPFTPERMNLASNILTLTCITGILGLFSRTSAIASFAMCYYLFGSYSSYGSTRHIFHIPTLALVVLACSRAADVLAIDAVRPAFRRADRGDVAPPQASATYGLPVKIIWHLFAFSYFFPGIWKLLLSGPEYLFGHNIRHIAWAARTGVEDFVPLAQPEALPLMPQLMGFATLSWEISFFFSIFFPFTRNISLAIGQMFHTSTIFLLGIRFVYMQAMYAWFLPWDTIFTWIGPRLFREDLRVAYDAGCGPCRRTIAVLSAFDLFHRVKFIPATDRATLESEGMGHLTPAALAENMHAARGLDIASGYDAYRWIATRIPFLWPLRLVMDLPPVAAIGRRIYRKVADSRACRIARPPIDAGPIPVPRIPIPTVLAGLTLCGGFVLMGSLKFVNAWPIPCFPTFSGPTKPQMEFVDRRVVLADGSEAPYTHQGLRADIGDYHRGVQFDSLCARLVSRDGIEDGLPAIVDFWASQDPLPEGARAVRIYRNVISTRPEDQADRILEERLFYEFDLTTRHGHIVAPSTRLPD